MSALLCNIVSCPAHIREDLTASQNFYAFNQASPNWEAAHKEEETKVVLAVLKYLLWWWPGELPVLDLPAAPSICWAITSCHSLLVFSRMGWDLPLPTELLPKISTAELKKEVRVTAAVSFPVTNWEDNWCVRPTFSSLSFMSSLAKWRGSLDWPVLQMLWAKEESLAVRDQAHQKTKGGGRIWMPLWAPFGSGRTHIVEKNCM